MATMANGRVSPGFMFELLVFMLESYARLRNYLTDSDGPGTEISDQELKQLHQKVSDI